MLWELRYRGAMSVDNVLIETLTEREEEAIELGQAYLDSLATPSVRFVRVRKIVVDRTHDHAGMKHKWSQVPVKPTPPADEDEEMAPAAVVQADADPVSPPTPAAATRGKVKENAPSPRAGKTAAPNGRAKVTPPKGTDPPPEPEGPRVQTHNRDVRAEARAGIINATRTGRAGRSGRIGD